MFLFQHTFSVQFPSSFFRICLSCSSRFCLFIIPSLTSTCFFTSLHSWPLCLLVTFTHTPPSPIWSNEIKIVFLHLGPSVLQVTLGLLGELGSLQRSCSSYHSGHIKTLTLSLSGCGRCVHGFHQGPDGFAEANDGAGKSDKSWGGLLSAPRSLQHPSCQL